jgi:hypothetical protein
MDMTTINTLVLALPRPVSHGLCGTAPITPATYRDIQTIGSLTAPPRPPARVPA